ncbi:MAG: T9SS type A sorting domain-containing protein [Cyclobacteriaceae bacterium]|nr:T9SS type A sorting domain-containing protein [Cyclobacteriaceae bacterium]
MRFYLFISFSLISHVLFSQKEATHWFFGSKAGLYFDPGGPSPLHGSAMNTQEGCAVISHKETGELLFYSNGRNVWNRKHQLMPNGRDFPDECWSGITQSALIVPFPGDDSKFYLFSIFYTTEPGGSIFIEQNCNYGQYATPLFREVRYSLIDMTLDKGMGDVVADSKHVLLQLNATEKLVAVPHANENDYWIITHAFGSSDFYVYALTHEGISEPEITAIGSPHELKPDLFFADEEATGNMKASPDGTKLACAVASRSRPFDLFDFNPATGQIDNYINLGMVSGQYGLSFSPDNSKLYVTTDDRPEPNVYPHPDIIIQYDLNAGDVPSIIASRKSIFRDNPFTNVPGNGIFEGFLLLDKGLQLAPDGRLYSTGDYAYSPTNGKVMVVIERPNEAGYDCRVNYKRFDFRNGNVGSGLPNFIESYFNRIESGNTCSEGAALSIYPNPTYGIVHLNFLEGCDPYINITVFNALGQRIAAFESNEQETEIDISAWANGIYFFVLSTQYTQRLVRRITKV